MKVRDVIDMVDDYTHVYVGNFEGYDTDLEDTCADKLLYASEVLEEFGQVANKEVEKVDVVTDLDKPRYAGEELTGALYITLKEDGMKNNFKNKVAENRYYEQEATQEEFLEWYKTQDFPNYPKPSVTADAIIVANDGSAKEKILLIKRKCNPFRDCWAIPGGFMEMDEPLIKTVIREVKEETTVDVKEEDIHFLGMYDDVSRDPRGRVLSMAHIVSLTDVPKVEAMDDAVDAQWFDLTVTHTDWILTGEQDGTIIQIKTYTPKADEYYAQMAFDHAKILHDAFKYIFG